MIKNPQASLPYKNLVLLPILVLFIALIFGAKEAAEANNSYRTPINEVPVSANNGSVMKDCTNTSTGLTPLIDMGRDRYQGYGGGLYLLGNQIPNSHLQIGLDASQNIEPLNVNGQPDASGKIVVLSVGMSNVKREFGAFMNIARDGISKDVALVNGAQGGYDAAQIANPTSDYWPQIDDQLSNRNLSPLQVQVIWLKEAVATESDPFPQDALELKGYLRKIILIVENRFPNIETVYLSSRIYGGYAAPNGTSPEPWAYQGGFAVKWLIGSQVEGTDPFLAYSNTPWLAWGPYLWADGLSPRSDGLIWKCSDFENDGIHPSEAGAAKVAGRLLLFFEYHPTTQSWFLE